MQMNRITAICRLTKDPELKYLPSGIPVLSMDCAINTSYKDKAGEWKQEACFIRVNAWNKLATALSEVCNVQKGTEIFLEGPLKQKTWETKDGQKRSTIEITAMIAYPIPSMKVVEGADTVQERDALANKQETPQISDDEVPF